MNGPDYDQTEIITFYAIDAIKNSKIENRPLYRLKAVDPQSTFLICERYVAGQNSVKLLAELKTKYSHSICSPPRPRYNN